MVAPVRNDGFGGRRAWGEIAGLGSDPYTLNSGVFYGGRQILNHQDQLLVQEGGAGPRAIELYSDLLADPVVFSAFEKIIAEIIQRDYSIVPASQDREDLLVAEFVKRCLDGVGMVDHNKEGQLILPYTPGFNSIYRGLLEAYITGISIGEITWNMGENRSIKPTQIQIRDPRRFQMILKEGSVVQPTVLSDDSPSEGLPIPARQMVIFRYWGNQHHPDPYGAGIGRQLYYLVQFRRAQMSNWASYSDRFTVPSAVGRYPKGIPQEDKFDFKAALDRLGYESSMAIPLEFEVDWLNTDGKPEVYKDYLEYIDAKINMLIAGEAIVGENGGGSRARDQIADDARLRKAKALSDLLDECLNATLISWIVQLNFKPGTRIPTLVRRYPELSLDEDPSTLIANVKALKDLGIKVSTEWLAKKLDMPLSEAQTKSAPLDPEGEKAPNQGIQTSDDNPPNFERFDQFEEEGPSELGEEIL